MARRGSTRRGSGRRPRRKFDIYRHSTVFNGVTTGVNEVEDIGAAFVSQYGAKPFQSTWSIPRFDISCQGTGTGTGLNFATVGWMVGPSTLDAADLDPVVNPDLFWWVRKFALQNNSNPAGMPWAIQGEDSGNMRVNTRRTWKVLGDTLWLAVRPDFTGFTALQTTLNVNYGILYA